MDNKYYENRISKSYESLDISKICKEILDVTCPCKSEAKACNSEEGYYEKMLDISKQKLMIYLFSKANVNIPLSEWSAKFNAYIQEKLGNDDKILKTILERIAVEDESEGDHEHC